MRAVIQRVTKAQVDSDGEMVGAIGPGLVVLLGVGAEDSEEDAAYLADKIVNLRIFNDQEGRLNCSALELRLSILVVSQFTLYGDCRKGRRPSFTGAADPADGENLYRYFCTRIENHGLTLATGRFRTQMQIELINDGPVTLLLDSKRLF